MKEILNVFQFDWAMSPAMAENKPEKLKNKSILISGHETALALAYTIQCLNDKLNLGAKVFLCSSEENFQQKIIPNALERGDLIYNTTDHIDEIKQKIDIVIHTGLCGVKIETDFEQYKSETKTLRAVINLAKKRQIEKIILLSDSRVYGKGENKHRAFAEMEMGNANSDNFSVQLLRSIESTFSYETQKLNSATLRTGVILGAGSKIYNGLESVFEAVSKGEKTDLYSTENKISFVYMTDVFNAIYYLIDKNINGVYNISGIDSTVSTGTLAAMLHDIFGSNAKIKMLDNGDFEGNELNCGKIAFSGYAPTINLKTALELSVMSYTKENVSDFRFADEHYGRLNAIQEILMAYLLEVDKICKKHNIKWYLGGGTLLGAARHKGFIPWDDDVDIMMLRDDYDKFLEVAPDELPDGMILQDPKKDKTYNYCYAKLRLTDTIFATDFSKNHKGMNNGFAFDIFCHDKTANSKLGQKIHSQLTLFWLAMVFNKWNHRRVYNGKKVQSAISNFCKNIFPLRFSMRMLLFTLEMFKHKKNAKYLYDGMGKSVHKGGFDRTFLDDEIRLDFNGYKMPVPAKYKEYLTNHYGDYMELAPLSTRLMGHEITLSDLNKYAQFQISNKEIRGKGF
ncbi:MAG: LicD family protein [Ruminococcus sp.]|nr:LicD family protein [Ruminococcus sp.]